MAILYQLPRIGEQSPNKWGQRGPTCWYYVSKMLLKFHDKIQPASEYYERFKAMHELRRILTEMDADGESRGARNDKSIVTRRLEAATLVQLRNINSRNAALVEVSRKLRTAQGQAAVKLREHLKKLQELIEKGRVELSRKVEAIDALKSYESSDLSRAKIFESFFPDGTFTIVKADVWLGNGFTPERLEECLASWGPCYAGGAFSVNTIDRSGNNVVGGDRIVNVTDFRAGSAHAIVIAGIDGNTVYYKDPNHSDELATCSFQHLETNLSKDDNRLFIAVNCAPDQNTGRCGHMNAGAIRRPDHW